MKNSRQNKNRRQFLVQGIATMGALGISPLLAYGAKMMNLEGMSGMNHGSMMGGMDHGKMMAQSGHGMMQEMGVPPMVREGYQLGLKKLTLQDIEIMRTANQNLLPIDKMPTGSMLPDLKLLPNESTVAGEFKGTLRVQKAHVSLLPGVNTEVWAYNGEIPGPQIVVAEGDTVSITVINELDEPTTVHWHGLLVPASEDGNPQDEIKPQGSRVYTFKIPEGTAGTYWYHPHGHGTVSKQVFKGLAGTFIVKAKEDVFKGLPEKHLLMSDLKLHQDGSIAENSFFDWMNGREGQFTLVNGALNPKIELEGATRVRVWNACSARYLYLDLTFADSYLIATDGGFIEKPQLLEKILLSPGERIELVMIPKRNGQVELMNLSYNRSKMGPVSVTPSYALATINMRQGEAYTLPGVITELPEYQAPTKTHSIEYREVMNRNQLLFLVNGKMHDMDRIDEVVEQGAVEEWIVFNNTHMDHNFHIHGTQFYVVEQELNGMIKKITDKAFKDTINLKPYERLTLVMKQEDQGLRMYHCHILEHETLGMMGQLETV